jgi:hypothetical protein
MKKFNKLIKTIDELEKLNIIIDNKLGIFCKFKRLDYARTDKLAGIILNAFKNILLHDIKKITNVISIVDLIEVETRYTNYSYAITYKIKCDHCNSLSYVTVNCYHHRVPKYCEDCSDRFRDYTNDGTYKDYD